MIMRELVSRKSLIWVIPLVLLFAARASNPVSYFFFILCVDDVIFDVNQAQNEGSQEGL